MSDSPSNLFRPGNEEDTRGMNEKGIDSRPRKWVVVHNEMVLARVDWDIHMNRIFAMLVSQISMEEDEFTPQRIRVCDLRDLSELSTKNIHERLADAAQALIREPIEFRTPDHNYKGISIFSTCEYLRQEGAIEAKFNEDARPYLLQLRESFTRYKLQQVMRLSTPYAVRFYQIAKMIQRTNGPRTRVIKIPQFRELFMLEDKYEKHSGLNQWVIEPSVEEVNEKTNTYLRVETVRKGSSKYGRPIGLKWTVWPSSTKGGNDSRSTDMPLTGSTDAMDRFERWWARQDQKWKKEVVEKARRLVEEEGRSPDQPAFNAHVQVKLREITRSERP